jgi:hypothetical protein
VVMPDSTSAAEKNKLLPTSITSLVLSVFKEVSEKLYN